MDFVDKIKNLSESELDVLKQFLKSNDEKEQKNNKLNLIKKKF